MVREIRPSQVNSEHTHLMFLLRKDHFLRETPTTALPWGFSRCQNRQSAISSIVPLENSAGVEASAHHTRTGGAKKYRKGEEKGNQ